MVHQDDAMTRRGDGRLGRPPLPPGLKNERFSSYVPEAVLEGLDTLAIEQHTTRTNLVRAILTDYVAARRPLPPGVCAEGATGPAARAAHPDPGAPTSGGGRP